jgi:hypothetical protein
MKLNFNLNIGLKGRVRTYVVDAKTKEVKQDLGWRDNLITDSGLDLIASNPIAACMQYAVAGTSSATPVVGDTTLTAQVLNDAGWSSTYVAGQNSTSRLAGAVTHTRMYDFDSPVGSTIYREAGVTPNSVKYTGGSFTPVFNRVLLNGTTGVTVDSTEQLRIVYELTVTYSPVGASNAKTALLTHPSGNVDGDWALASFVEDVVGQFPYETIDADGSRNFSQYSRWMEPSFVTPSTTYGALAWMSDTDKVLPGAAMWFQTYSDATHNWGKNVDTSAATVEYKSTLTAQAYSAGTKTRDLEAVFEPADGAITFKVFGMGADTTPSGGEDSSWQYAQSCVCVLDASALKANTQRFTFTFTYTWDRV